MKIVRNLLLSLAAVHSAFAKCDDDYNYWSTDDDTDACLEELYEGDVYAEISDAYSDMYSISYDDYPDEMKEALETVFGALCDFSQKSLQCYKSNCKCILEEAQAGLDDWKADVTVVDLSCTLSCDGCFPADAQVELPQMKKSMRQLDVGDNIHVGAGRYSEVYYFSTEMSETTAKFVKLSTEKTVISLTPHHYLYVNDQLVMAKTVQVGDYLTLSDGSTSAVISVDSEWGTGLYNPHTMSGDIVVDGILTSTYTGQVHPKLAHAMLFPLRKLYEVGVTFGTGFNGMTKAVPSWIQELIAV